LDSVSSQVVHNDDTPPGAYATTVELAGFPPVLKPAEPKQPFRPILVAKQVSSAAVMTAIPVVFRYLKLALLFVVGGCLLAALYA
jgi:hypothetical protein